jgi:hypothetical protein
MALATEQCRDLLIQPEETLLFKYTRSQPFTNVEVFRKNNDMGPQQMGRLSFTVWFELSFEFSENAEDTSIVGLTKEGQVYHLIQIGDRRVAYRLNGTKVFKDISVTNHGKILALTDKSTTEVYSPSLWATPAKEMAVKKWLKLFSVAAGIGILGAQFMPPLDLPIEMTIPYINLTLFNFNFPLYEIILTGAGALSSSFAALSFYQHINTYPDGFMPVDVEFDDPYWFDRIVFKQSILSHLDPKTKDLGVKLDSEFTQDIE